MIPPTVELRITCCFKKGVGTDDQRSSDNWWERIVIYTPRSLKAKDRQSAYNKVRLNPADLTKDA